MFANCAGGFDHLHMTARPKAIEETRVGSDVCLPRRRLSHGLVIGKRLSNVVQSRYGLVHFVPEAAEGCLKIYLMPCQLLPLRGSVDLLTSRTPSHD